MDGRVEDFDRNKIVNGVIKSGAPQDQAESIAAQIETWAQGAATDGIIKARDIRNKVLEALRSLNPEAASSFETYKKTV